MNWGHHLVSEIRKLAGFSGTAPKTVCVSGPNHVDLAVDVTAADSMSCSCREIRMRVPGLAGADASVLEKWAQNLCARVTYLLEQIQPLEIDQQAKQVLLRSQSPDKRQNATTFYEILLQSQGAGLFTLRRYRRNGKDAPREHVDLTMTHEVLERLADDLNAATPSP